MPKKSTKETEVKIAAETPKKRAAAPKTAASTHKRAATKTLAEKAETSQPIAAAAVAAPKPEVVKPVTGKVAANPTVEREQIATMAYYLWLERGASGGGSDQDWFRAEQIVRAKATAA